jgi:hypothetical protein
MSLICMGWINYLAVASFAQSRALTVAACGRLVHDSIAEYQLIAMRVVDHGFYRREAAMQEAVREAVAKYHEILVSVRADLGIPNFLTPTSPPNRASRCTG